MMYILLVCQLLLGATLLFAASGKFLRSEEFLSALRLSHIPQKLLLPIAIGIPSVEAILAICLVLGSHSFLTWVFTGTLGLLGIFTLWMISVYARKLRIKCGCFGTASSYVDLRSIVRNILFLGASLGGLLMSSRVHRFLLKPSFWLLMSVISIGLCLILIQAFHNAKPALHLSLEGMPKAD